MEKTPKEKAEELIERFQEKVSFHLYYDQAIEAAIISINLIIEEHLHDGSNSYVNKRIDHLNDVKKELKNLNK